MNYEILARPKKSLLHNNPRTNVRPSFRHRKTSFEPFAFCTGRFQSRERHLADRPTGQRQQSAHGQHTSGHGDPGRGCDDPSELREEEGGEKTAGIAGYTVAGEKTEEEPTDR